jgi:hypothetical protein
MDLRPLHEHAVVGAGYDSGRGGPHRALRMGPGLPDDSIIYSLYNEAQFYPEFIVTFQKTGVQEHLR